MSDDGDTAAADFELGQLGDVGRFFSLVQFGYISRKLAIRSCRCLVMALRKQFAWAVIIISEHLRSCNQTDSRPRNGYYYSRIW